MGGVILLILRLSGRDFFEEVGREVLILFIVVELGRWLLILLVILVGISFFF